ncbi:MAG: response regulator [Vampirovibrionales bacterium]|nr:response regulator [Vampirovibrionales bacterium]
MKVLIADDVSYSLNVAKIILQKAGYEVLCASCGEEAMEILHRESNLGAVLIDYLMPDMNGVEVYRECQKLKRYSGLNVVLMPPFLLLTAVSDARVYEEAERLGFLSVLQKPLDPQELLDIMNDIQSGKALVNKEEKFLKIMLVESADCFRKTIEEVLSSTGHILFRVGSAQEAINHLKQDFTISVIISNIALSDMDGLEFFRQGLAIERYNDEGAVPLPPFILLAESIDAATLQDAQKLGIDDLLIKPINTDRLRSRLTEIYLKQKGRSQTESSSQKVLVVDDIGFMRSLISSTLNQQGLSVLTASSGEEAYDMIKRDESIAVIVTDLYMPEMDGIELFKKSQELFRRRNPLYNPDTNPSFVLITASSDFKTLTSAEQAGFTDVLRKPLSMETLSERIQKILEDKRAANTTTPNATS